MGLLAEASAIQVLTVAPDGGASIINVYTCLRQLLRIFVIQVHPGVAVAAVIQDAGPLRRGRAASPQTVVEIDVVDTRDRPMGYL